MRQIVGDVPLTLALINAVLHVIRADRELAQELQPLDARRRES